MLNKVPTHFVTLLYHGFGWQYKYWLQTVLWPGGFNYHICHTHFLKRSNLSLPDIYNFDAFALVTLSANTLIITLHS